MVVKFGTNSNVRVVRFFQQFCTERGPSGEVDNILIQNLPYIFGNPKVNEFLNFKKVLDGSPVMYGEIKNLYFFQSKRWDLQLKNNILIKLPKSSVENALNDVSEFIKLNSSKNFKVIDARVKNQIIINE